MNQKTLGVGLFVVGAIVVIISVFAEFIGAGNKTGFGLYQGLGTLAGLITGALGAWWATRKDTLPAAPALEEKAPVLKETRPRQKAPSAKSTVGKKRSRQKTAAVKKMHAPQETPSKVGNLQARRPASSIQLLRFK